MKRSTADEEQQYCVTEIIDDKTALQIKAREKQNRTFVLPKLKLVQMETKETKIPVLRGKERAAKHAFMKELVASNSVTKLWNVNRTQSSHDLDDFFRKKQRKSFSRIDLKELENSLLGTPDLKREPQFANTDSIKDFVLASEVESVSASMEHPQSVAQAVNCEEILVPIPPPRANNTRVIVPIPAPRTIAQNDVVALTQQIIELNKMMSTMLQKMEKLEDENQELKQRLQGKEQPKKSKNAIKKEKRMAKVEKPFDEVDGNITLTSNKHKKEEIISEEKPEIVRKTREIIADKKVKVTVTKNVVTGEEQCDIVGTPLKKFDEKPKKPNNIKRTDKKRVVMSKIYQWYNYDPKDLEKHQQEVLSSIVDSRSYATVTGVNGLPTQKLKYKPKKEVKPEVITPFNQKMGYNYYGKCPRGIPKNLWWKWCTENPVLDAFEMAYKFQYRQFKKQVYDYRAKWSKVSKEFNPYLAECKLVWENETHNWEWDQDCPDAFIQKWKKLVQTYQPTKPVATNWYEQQ